jgi:hypothetical protein
MIRLTEDDMASLRSITSSYAAAEHGLDLDTTPSHLRRLNSGPLVALVQRIARSRCETETETVRTAGLCVRTFQRFKASGVVSMEIADLFACRLLVPTGDVYPQLRVLESEVA